MEKNPHKCGPHSSHPCLRIGFIVMVFDLFSTSFYFLSSSCSYIYIFFLGLIEFEECDPASAVEGKLTSCDIWQLANVFCLLNK